MLRLLCVTAHPDDESGGFGGTLLHYSRLGVETQVVCLTAGEAATYRGGAESDQELIRLRRQEFQHACKILEISHGEVLDYPDGGLDRVPLLEVVSALVRRIRKQRPHVVLSFGQEGAFTAHPDHSMASVFATLAFHWAGRTNRFTEQIEKEGLGPYRPQKLYYSTVAFTLPERQPVSLPPITAEIDISAYVEKKIEAFRAHTSQNPLLRVFSEAMRQEGSREMYHLAAAITPGRLGFETDLFAGIEE